MEEVKIEFGAIAREIQHAIDTGAAYGLGKQIGKGIVEEVKPKTQKLLLNAPNEEGWQIDYSQLQEITENSNRKNWAKFVSLEEVEDVALALMEMGFIEGVQLSESSGGPSKLKPKKSKKGKHSKP